MKLYIIRHGETDWNLEKKIQDRYSSKLTQNGESQAGKIKGYLEKNKIIFDKIFYSPTLRTKQTLEILLPSYLDHNHIIKEDDIEERDHKDLIGKRKQDIEKQIGQELPHRFTWELYFEGTEKSVLTDRFPGNETIDNITNRITSFFDKLLKEPTDSTTLIIGHSEFNQYILEYLKFRTTGKNHFGDYQKNNEIIILELDVDLQITEFDKIEL